MILERYLERIGYDGSRAPTLETLRALHRAHLLAIPYENLDVQLGERVELGAEAAYEKIVERRRGGWCFEMNGLLAWALRELGYDVTLIGSTPGRSENGDAGAMNHLVLLVRLDRPYVADVGWGNGFLFPQVLAEGSYSDGRFDFRFERLDDGWWRFFNAPQTGDTFDFTERGYLIEDFARKNDWLQSSPDSKFVQNLVCHRQSDDGIATLRGAVLRIYTPAGVTEEIASSAAELARILDTRFDVRTARIGDLWNRVAERHAAWLKDRTVPQ